MAGGTGGHVFPALAAARVLRERGFEPVWLGTERGMEARLVPPAQIPIEWVSVVGLRGKGATAWLLAPFHLLRALRQSLAVIRRRRPDVVLGAGGFVSGPGGVAAWLARCPLVIHEQNAVAGLTNRLLSRLAVRVLEAFPGSFGRRNIECVGNPVRREIAQLPAPRERFAKHEGPLRLFVVGGSQGAARLNAVLPAALALLPAELRPQVIHQAGESHYQKTTQSYLEQGVAAQVRAFIDDMADMYAWADLVVCRAGALTVSELAAAGVGAIFIPFAAAVDDHQTRNAEYLVRVNAARLIAEKDLSPQRLASELKAVLSGGRAYLLEMAESARQQAITDADVRLAEVCIAAAGAQK
ncbi:MAG: undecaprenyldiphospho-muramoylpentapeptide beta-N-acetylglucosaminyltransferase [Candidatus Obscuribacterales bacterium]|nr:undecaprenyldiphospho-muramoylpentapeptide beta-N-acetylglucosaminyltransferase [Steroidobacteraceae bacterium]